MILRGNLSEFTEDVAPFMEQVIGKNFDPYPSIAGQFLNKKTMSTGWTEIGTRSDLGTFSVKQEVGEQAEDTYIIGPKLRVEAIEYGKRVPKSRIAIEDCQDFEHAAAMLGGVASDIRNAADLSKEILGHDILNNYTRYLTPDGIALFHANASSDGHIDLQSTRYSNMLTSTALSESNLETAITKLKSFTTDRGAPIYQMPAKLIVPLALEWTAMKILETPLKTASPNNDINVMSRQNIQLVVSPFLTSDTAWFLQAGSHELNWYDRETFRAWTDTDDNRGIFEQGATYRCAVAAGDPRGIIRCVA
jgi:hypothetical protein